MIAAALLLLLSAADGVPQHPPAVPDTELAAQRGGFALPNGIDVALTVQTQTTLNGAIVLRSVFRADQGPATLATYAPRAGETVIAGTAAMRAPVVIVAAGAADVVPEGLVRIDAATATDSGTVSQLGRTAELRAADLSITHLAGNAFGSAITNAGSDRTIDTQTAVSIDLRNAGPDVLGSAMLRVQELGLDALRGRQ